MTTRADVDADTTLYVIGDIHGRLDLLDVMIEKIKRDVEAHGSRKCMTVTLGDYVDRGPASKGVIDRLVGNPFPTSYVPLKGNHEELFEEFLKNPSSMDRWRKLGGIETLHSYAVPIEQLMVGRNFDEAANALRSVLPPEHRSFLSSLKTWTTFGNFFMCHAGVRPGTPLDQQADEDLLWIRQEFLGSTMDFGKVVVHGHTPTDFPEILPNRINIDTGAYLTGRLTCLVVEQNGRRFLLTG